MKRKILSIEEVRAMEDEFSLPEEEGFYQYILEDDIQRMIPEDDIQRNQSDDEYENYLQRCNDIEIEEYERDKEERRHYGRYNHWLAKNGLINTEEAYSKLSNLFYKIDYYYIGGPCEPKGYVNSYEYDKFYDIEYKYPAQPSVKIREINEEYSLRKYEALKSISPNATDKEIEKFLYLYEYNTNEFYLPTEIKRVRDYLQEEENINDFRFTLLSEILNDVKDSNINDVWK